MWQCVHESANSQPAPTSGVQIVRKILQIFCSNKNWYLSRLCRFLSYSVTNMWNW
jgi:hypothetical protein